MVTLSFDQLSAELVLLIIRRC